MSGELTKVKIKAFKDKSYNTEIGEFVLPINPEQLTQSFKLKNNEEQESGTQGNDPQYILTLPQDLKLDFTLDGTGVVPVKEPVKENGVKFHKDVPQQVFDLMRVAYNMNAETHRPNFLRLIWGDFPFSESSTGKGFSCILKDLQINYTLFSAAGKPLRAKISATFTRYTQKEEQEKNSPDVTHRRKVKAGDTLPLMTYDIYRDSNYYLQVAKVNGLINFRRLKTNDNLRFPPLRGTSS